MYKIIKKVELCASIKLMKIHAPLVAAKALAGQFVILRTHNDGERIPVTIADFDRAEETITCVFQEVGKTTKELGTLNEGECLKDFVGPLGVPSHIKNYGRVACVGGGVGVAPVYPIARALKEAGNEMVNIMGARNRELIFWEDRMRAISDELLIATDDGSYMRKGFVTDLLKEVIEDKGVDLCIAIGPMPMMRAVCELTKKYGVKTVVSLNTLMVDGTGMCGCCRVTVGGETKFVCVDGPEFNGHEVDFLEIIRRSAVYKTQEKISLDRYAEKGPNPHRCTCGGDK